VSLSIVIPICDAHAVARAAIGFLRDAISDPGTEIIALDN